MRRDWITPSNPSNHVLTSRAKYDSYGNARLIFDPMGSAPGGVVSLNTGHAREITYDPRFFAYPIGETIHIGNGASPLFFQAEYDEGFGVMISSLDFNSNRTDYVYDPFARLTTVVRPYDSLSLPTTEYDYRLAIPTPYWSGNIVSTGLVNYIETRQLDRTPGGGARQNNYLFSRTFSDGLGRSLMTRMEAEPAPREQAPRVVVTGAVLFNARAKEAAKLNPFFTSKTGSLDQLLEFENIEMPGWIGLFHKNGNLVTLDRGSAHKSQTEYDETLRSIRTINPDGSFSRTEFEPLLVRNFDENDCATNSPYFGTPVVQFTDGLGRLIQLDEIVKLNDDGTPASALKTWTTRYKFDLNDRLTQITDSQTNVKTLRYDGLKRKIWMNDPDSGISTNIYDDVNNLTETRDAKNQRITYTYDGANRTLTEDYHDEDSSEFSYHRSPDVTYHYDTPLGQVDQGNGSRASARNTRGMLAWVEDTTGQEHTSYDARGRIEWTVKRVPDPVLNTNIDSLAPILVSYRSAFQYDSLDRVTRLIYPDNDEVTYAYNARGLLDSISGGPSGFILAGVGYLPSAQEERIDYGNGVRTTYEYDSRLRLNHLLTISKPASVNQQLINFAYDLDGVSNIRSIEDLRPLSLVSSDDARRNTQRFQYDDLYRLTQVRYNAPDNSQSATNVINYRYDRIGNILSQVSDMLATERGLPVANLGALNYGGVTGRHGRDGRLTNDPPGPHALSSVASNQPGATNRVYSYDANGNMQKIDGLHCTWDFMDRLVQAEDESMRAEYRYDFTGRRIIKRVLWKNGEPLPANLQITQPSGLEQMRQSAVTEIK
jgi:YD repeat-containing protein